MVNIAHKLNDKCYLNCIYPRKCEGNIVYTKVASEQINKPLLKELLRWSKIGKRNFC